MAPSVGRAPTARGGGRVGSAARPPAARGGRVVGSAARPPAGGRPDDVNLSLRERLDLFRRLATPYFQHTHGAKLNFGLMLLLVLAKSGIAVGFSYISRDFYSALAERDQVLFLEKAAAYSAGFAAATPISALYTFQKRRLALNWREWMTAELTRQYTSDQAYYRLEVETPRLDNPDQRITEDVRAFTSVSLGFVITLTNALIDLVSFSGILYSIYPELFYAIFAYAAFGTVTTIQLGRALVGQNAEQLLLEADLRYALVRLRDNAESIAFYRGEQQEAEEVGARLGRAVENQRGILATQRDLEFFTVAYKYLIQILPVLVVSPLYFSGAVQLGVITQASPTPTLAAPACMAASASSPRRAPSRPSPPLHAWQPRRHRPGEPGSEPHPEPRPEPRDPRPETRPRPRPRDPEMHGGSPPACRRLLTAPPGALPRPPLP